MISAKKICSAGRDQGRACFLKGVAWGPLACDLLDFTEAVRVDRAPKAQGVMEMEAGLDGEQLRHLGRASQGAEHQGNLEADCDDLCKPVGSVPDIMYAATYLARYSQSTTEYNFSLITK